METVTPQLSKREKLKLIMELNGNISKLENSDGSLAKREKLKVIMRTNTLLDLLGFNVDATEPAPVPVPEPVPPIVDTSGEDPDKVENERKVTRGIRQKANNAAIDLLKQIKSGEIEEVTDAMREVLKGYTGSGGNLTTADGLKGSIYEYYTPKPIAQGVWNLLGDMGFAGGKVLDPSAGTGIFGQTAPKSALVDAIELDDISGSINQLINPTQNVKVSPFEAIAANTPEEMYDAVVTNVPFGSVTDRGGNAALDPRYKSKSLEYYFILRSLDKLKPNGLAAFIVPPRVVEGKDGMEMDLRYYSSLKAEFKGAYRLPNSVFGDAHADTITDVVVFKKHSKEVAEKIKELLREKPEVLTQANVLFDEFLTGKYFHGEGKRFVLGEFVAKDPNKYRDVNRVINNGKVSDIAKLLQKFPDSRIDWPMFGAAETMPIFYNEGDTIAQDGRILAFKNGEWVPVESSQDDIEMLNIGATLNTAINAIMNKVTYEKADKYYMDAMRRADYDAIPYWLRRTVNAIVKVGGDANTATNTFNGLMTAFALNEVLDHHAQSEPFNYLADYPELSDAIKINRKFATSTNTAIDVDMREMVSLFKVFYNQKKNEFSARWRGDVQTADDLRIDTSGLSEYQRYEKLKYGRSAHGSMNFIPLDVLKKELGEQFDPFTNDDWCISTDGKSAIHREDYFTGRYSDYLGFADLEIMNAENEQVKAKLMRQKAISSQFAPKLDVTKMTFGIRGPFVSNEDKLDFLRRYVDTRYELVMDLDGKEKFVFNGVSKHSDSDHAKYRLTFYMNGQTARTGTTAQTKEDDPVREARRKKLLDELVQVAESQFGVWVKSNSSLMTRLDAKANANENLHFANVYNGSPLKIDGIKDDFQGKLHDYQNSAVRQYSRNFGGILGFDVGLGKTFTALATIQYVQAIGVKNKTIITVPASVLSNWRREAMAMYTDASMEECLFVGLRLDPSKVDKNGVIGTTYDSAKVAEDLNRILENKHKKIFMTAESFAKIPMRQETLEEYVSFMQTADESFGMQSDKSRDAVKQESLAQSLLGDSGKDKAANVPYFEDMGVDSLVGDEFHVYKNSKQTVDFKGAKFLSKAEASGRGIDAQIKCWYIRDRSPHGDGVLGLTATPITNSPLEIYSMLSLAVGEKRVSEGLLGARGADAFMMGVCDIQTKEELNIVGDLSNADVFVGLNNVGLIRGLLGQVANVKSAAEVNLKIPEKNVIAIPVDLELETVDQLKEFKTIYGIARRMVNPKANPQPTANEIAYVEEFSERYGEPAKLLANPFNLISKMTDLIVDHDLTYKFSKWDIDPSQQKIAETVVEAFNKLSIKEERTRLTILSTEDDIVKTKAKKKADPDGEDEPPLLIVMVKAIVKDNAILLDSVDFKTQSRLLAICEKRGLNLKVTFSPKIAAMIENFKKEEATPRMGSKAKQLIFCDNKGLHNKLKQALVQECGIPASQIIIINGITGKDAGDLQEMQDGFNSVPDEIEGTDYVFRVAICNKKAEVGINLQKGTQAIHHLTIGWTPDSIQQRDGRGVRQGNKIEKVNVYMYDANGTFDEYKRMLVGKKSNWIGDVLAKDGSDKVATNSEISSKDYEDLVNSIGDADATRKARERIEENAKKAAIMLAKSRQVQNVKIAAAQVTYLKNTGEYEYIRNAKVKFVSLMEKAKKLQAASVNEKVSEGFRQRNKAKLAEIQPQLDKLMAEIKNGMTGMGRGVDHSDPEAIWMSYNSSTDKTALEWAKNTTGSGIRLTPESDLHDAWQQDIAVANNMIEEAGKAFALEEGGYPASVFAMYREGKAILLSNGTFVCDKSWVSHVNGGLYLALTTNDGRFNVVKPLTEMKKRGDMGHMTSHYYSASDLEATISDGNVTLTQFFDSDYSKFLVLAAKADDISIQAGNASQPNSFAFFSDYVPEVAQFTTAKPTVWFSMFSCTLPSPNFPYIANSGAAMLNTVPAIARQQQAILKQNPADSMMYTLIDENVEMIPYVGMPSDYRKEGFRTLIDYLEAEGIVVNADSATSAIGINRTHIVEVLQPVISGAVKSALERDAEKTFTNDADGLAYAYEVARMKLSFFETTNLADDFEYRSPDMFMLAMLTQDVISELKSRNDIPTNPYLSKIDAVSANGLVGIGISAQYPNGLKDIYKTIKSVCSSVSNKKAYWYGKATVWTVTVEACKYLTEHYPDDMRKVTFVNPSVSRLSIG